ncbi:MAG: hypothetical protein KDC98_08485, partial [Planctomycetes bacterium]|nr:hypothetical protein [Planctomycetota bacterium]
MAQSPSIPIPRYTGITTEFTTHDATTTVSHTPAGLAEAWADVKTTGGLVPGSGWTFCVGNIEVSTTHPSDNPTFSDVVVELPPNPTSAVAGQVGLETNDLGHLVGTTRRRPGGPWG